MKKYFYCFLFVLSGCAPIILDSMLKSTGDFAERMEKIDSARRKELRAEISTIEGEISKTEMVEKEIEDPSKSIVINDKKDSEKVMIKKKFYVINFSDGREKTFVIVPSKPLLKGNYYIIKFNGLDEILDISCKPNG